MIYRVVHGRHTAMKLKQGCYVEKCNGVVEIVGDVFSTWLATKAEADRLTELAATIP